MAGPRKSNPAQAEALLAQLRDQYLAELPSSIEALEVGLLSLQQGENAPQALADLYRQFHSLKGSAGTYGLDLVTRICHQAEEHLNPAVNGQAATDDAFIDRGLGYLDLMRDVVDGTRSNDDVVLQSVVQALERVRSDVLANRISGLIVEESGLNVALYEAVLADLNVHLSASNSSYAALQRILIEPYDVLITAQEMSVLSGSAMIAAVKCSEPPRPVCILITSNEDLQIPAGVAPDHVIVRGTGMKTSLHNVVARVLAAQRTPAAEP